MAWTGELILLLASPDDVHARRVAQEIEFQGYAAEVLNWQQAGRGLRVSANYQCRSAEYWIQMNLDATAVHLNDIRSVWNRRPGVPAPPLGVPDDDNARFARQEWHELLDGLMLSLASHACIINPLTAQRAAVKPYQLAIAQRVGLSVPRTLITSDPQHAAQFVAAHKGRVVHKSMRSPRTSFVDTRRWQETDRNFLDKLELAPTIFQELIEGPVDIRATIIGSEIYAAALLTSQSRAGLDSRLDLDVPATPYDLPRDIADRLHALMDALDLTFSTVDLKVDDAGQLHFLELNPQGQFLYIEILTGQPISAAVARYLVASHDRARED
jgi:glutathione synthase/RimK-type ligase-like ATP-grasp enzyme